MMASYHSGFTSGSASGRGLSSVPYAAQSLPLSAIAVYGRCKHLVADLTIALCLTYIGDAPKNEDQNVCGDNYIILTRSVCRGLV